MYKSSLRTIFLILLWLILADCPKLNRFFLTAEQTAETCTMKIHFLSPIMKPEITRVKQLEDNSEDTTCVDLLTNLGYPLEVHHLFRVYHQGEPLEDSDFVSGSAEISILLAIAGG